MMRLFTVLLLLVGCVEYYDPTIEPPENQPIVIQAFLTDELKNHQATISRAKYIDRPDEFAAIENAEVYLEDNNGGIYSYSHTQGGQYISDVAFAAVENLSYRIVVTIDSDVFMSDFESISAWGDIVDIKSDFVYQTTEKEPGVFSEEPRIEFLVDIELNQSEADSYFRFDWEATYSAETPNQGDSICWDEQNLDYPSSFNIETCYVTESPSSFLRIFTTEGLNTDNSIDNLSIYLVHPNKRFQFRYSPKITMYSISKSAYEFWELILNQNENTGGLFDPALSPITGNIQSTNESDERIIGVFEVASVTKSRAFFPGSMAIIELYNYNRECLLPTTDTAGNPMVFPRPLYCCDCTKLPNSTNIKPDFW